MKFAATRMLWAFLVVLSAVDNISLATAQPTCKVTSEKEIFTSCQPDGATRETAISLTGQRVELWFTAANQTAWFAYKLSEDARVTWQIISRTARPFVETAVFEGDLRRRPQYLRHEDRDGTAEDANTQTSVDRWDLNAHSEGTEFLFQVTTLQDPMEPDEYLYIQPSVVLGELTAPTSSSDTCGDNCEQLCQAWGGISVERTSTNQPTAECIDNVEVPCQCYCQEGIVGDVFGSDSCEDDFLEKPGAIVGVAVGAFVVLACCIMAILFVWYTRKANRRAAIEPESKMDGQKTLEDTEMATERNDEEEQMNRGKARADAEQPKLPPAPSQLWDSLLTMPDADLVYTKVLALPDGQVLVKRKFKLHQTGTSKRLKVLFPDQVTAKHHGFAHATEGPGPRRAPEISETTESESEADHMPIQQVPSILPKSRFDLHDDFDETYPMDDEDQVKAREQQQRSTRSDPQKKLRKKKKPLTTEQIVSAIERRMAQNSLEKKEVTRPSQQAPRRATNEPPGDITPTRVAAEFVASGTGTSQKKKQNRSKGRRQQDPDVGGDDEYSV